MPLSSSTSTPVVVVDDRDLHRRSLRPQPARPAARTGPRRSPPRRPASRSTPPPPPCRWRPARHRLIRRPQPIRHPRPSPRRRPRSPHRRSPRLPPARPPRTGPRWLPPRRPASRSRPPPPSRRRRGRHRPTPRPRLIRQARPSILAPVPTRARRSLPGPSFAFGGTAPEPELLFDLLQ